MVPFMKMDYDESDAILNYKNLTRNGWYPGQVLNSG
jgi:hypothetical protein